MDTTLVGNITRDPELRFTPSGQATASFGLAVNRTWTDRASQERREQTSFFDVVAWGTLAENTAQSLHKGDRVVVAGRLDQRTWETTEGEKRSKVEVVADEVAPSLRWAIAQVVKNDRRAPDEGRRGTTAVPGTAQWQRDALQDRDGSPPPAAAAPVAAPVAAVAAAPPAAAPAAGPWADEEPF